MLFSRLRGDKVQIDINSMVIFKNQLEKKQQCGGYPPYINIHFFIYKKNRINMAEVDVWHTAITEIRHPKLGGGGWPWICRVKTSERASGANGGSHRNCNLITAL